MPCWYDVRGLMILTLAYQITVRDLVDWFAANISRNHLEVAVGSGTVLQKCLEQRGVWSGGVIDAVDIDSAMVARSLRKLGEYLRVCRIMDAVQLPEMGTTYDSINLANCVHCFAEPSAVLSAVAKCLNSGGIVAANVLLHPERGGLSGKVAAAVNRYGQRKGILVRPYTVDEVCRLFDDAGLQRLRMKTVGNCVFIDATTSSGV